MRPPTRTAGREELHVVAQIASSSFEGALRASGTDGVMTRLFCTTEEGKNPLPLRAFTSGFLTGWSLAENVLVGRSCFWCGDDTLGARGNCESRAARELQVFGRLVGCVWTTALMGTRCCDRISCRLESEPRTWVVRAMEQPTSTKLQHESVQAYCHAKSETKSRDPKMVSASEQKKLEGMQFSHGPGQQWSQRQHHKQFRKAGDGRGQQRRWERPSRAKLRI